ncbi:MAG: HlyD family efflux transporter periplasmic adaptor subunit, partial [Stenotrophobium sp.]
DWLLVRAPKSGRVADLQLIKGDQLSVGSQVAVITPAGSKCLISVYVPPAHPEYAEKGVQATVFFPDGMRGRAVVTDVPDVAREVPSTSGGFGNPEMGVLVRMTLEDPGHEIPKSLSDGLPVKVRFSNQPSLEAIRKLEHTAMNYLQDTRSDWENVWSSVSKRRT